MLELITCFAFACSVQVVIGAKEFALAISATVIDAWGQIGTKIHFCCYIRTCLKPAENNKDVSTNLLDSTAE